MYDGLMRGSLRERRPGVYELRVYVGRDPVTGKHRYKSRAFHGGKREAGKALAALVNEVLDGQHRGTAGTFGALLDEWLDLIADQRSPTTIREYRRLVEVRIKPALGARPLTKLEPGDLDAFYKALTRQKLKAGSVRQVHAIIRRSLGQAVKWRWLTRNPAVDASPPPVEKPDLHPPTPAAVGQMVALADRTDLHMALLLRVAAATGARRGELCALRRSDVDLKDRRVTIARSVAEAPGGLVMKDTKTHAIRKVKIDPVTATALEEWFDVQDHIAKDHDTVPVIDPFVFSRRVDLSTPWHPQNVTQAFRALCRKVGIEGVRLHDLRHFNATQLLDAGVPVRTVSGRLGHAKASTTHDIYSHWIDARDDDAAEVMGKVLTWPQKPRSEAQSAQDSI